MVRLVFILFFGFILSQNTDALPLSMVDADGNSFNRHNISIGMWDDKIGISLIGYTYNIKQDRMNEYFIGAGTAILAFTGSVGWKHYHRRSDKFSVYSVFSEQIVAHLGFSGFMSTASISLEYNLTTWAQAKLGAFGLFIIRTDQDGNQFGAIPFMGLNFSF